MLEELREKADKVNKDREADLVARASAYHQTFVQLAAGKKILDSWVQRFCMTPLVGDQSAFQAGIAEGRRQVVKEIVDHISLIQKEGER